MHPRVWVCLLVPTIMENILILVSLFQASLWTWLVSGVIVENTLNIAQSDQAPKSIGWWFGASPPFWGPMISSYPNQRNHKKNRFSSTFLHPRSYRIDGCKDNCFMSWSSSDRFSRPRDGRSHLYAFVMSCWWMLSTNVYYGIPSCSQKETSLPTIHFQGLCQFQGGYPLKILWFCMWHRRMQTLMEAAPWTVRSLLRFVAWRRIWGTKTTWKDGVSFDQRKIDYLESLFVDVGSDLMIDVDRCIYNFTIYSDGMG